MNMRDLIPWGRNNNQAPVDYRSQEANPFLALHREMNRLFDETFRSLDGSLASFGSLTPWSANWPGVDISENDREIRVSAELPGVDEKDDIASRSFIAVENTAGNEIRGVGFLDGTRGIVVLLTCGASQCTTIEDAQALASTIYSKLKQVVRDTGGAK